MAREILVHPLAREDLLKLYEYIETRSGPAPAGRYIEKIETIVRNLRDMPTRGTPRDDLAAGIRTIALERRVLVLYRVEPDKVLILRIFYAGRDFSADDLPT